jgi:hypothetical protein
MRHGRLFLAGDAAHIVPPTGAKGLNLALCDVVVLANALRAALGDGAWELADAYSDTCLERVWRSTHFSWWMTSMLHVDPAADAFDEQLMTAQLRYVTSSRAQAQSLAENYTGYRPVRFELLFLTTAIPWLPGRSPRAKGPPRCLDRGAGFWRRGKTADSGGPAASGKTQRAGNTASGEVTGDRGGVVAAPVTAARRAPPPSPCLSAPR